MFAITRKTLSFCVGVGVVLLVLGILPQVQLIGDAQAQKVDYKHAINLAGGQRMLSQRMSKELLLVALEYNTRENLRNLRHNHDLFKRTLRGLRNGDSELALNPVTEAAVAEELDRIAQIWPLFEAALTSGMSQGKVSRDEVSIVADLSLPLLGSSDNAVKAFSEAATKGALFSMVENAIDQSGSLSMLSQKIAKEYLLIVYDQNAETNKSELKKSMDQFEKTLNGLVAGDPELQLIPAPTQELQSQLSAVKRAWEEWKPILQSAVRGTEQIGDQLADTASLNLIVLTEADTAVRMYEAF